MNRQQFTSEADEIERKQKLKILLNTCEGRSLYPSLIDYLNWWREIQILKELFLASRAKSNTYVYVYVESMSKTYGDAYPHFMGFSNSITTEYNTQKLVLKKLNQICLDYLRHKTDIMLPDVIRKAGIPCSMTIPRWLWTVHGYLPRGSSRVIQLWWIGDNLNLNLAEAVNFASHRWVDYGLMANLCKCKSQKPIRLDMDAFLKFYKSSDVEGL